MSKAETEFFVRSRFKNTPTFPIVELMIIIQLATYPQ